LFERERLIQPILTRLASAASRNIGFEDAVNGARDRLRNVCDGIT